MSRNDNLRSKFLKQLPLTCSKTLIHLFRELLLQKLICDMKEECPLYVASEAVPSQCFGQILRNLSFSGFLEVFFLLGFDDLELSIELRVLRIKRLAGALDVSQERVHLTQDFE